MKPFTEDMRYDYPLDKDSLVVDVGGYEGKFASTIYQKYKCRVWCFEPVFYNQLIGKLDPAIKVYPFGLSSEQREGCMFVKGDMTGSWAEGEAFPVLLKDVNEILKEHVTVLKLNCEGGEFEILEAILDRGNPILFENIQVQFHTVVEDYENRWKRIRERLLKTHELTYDAPWCWENYRRIW